MAKILITIVLVVLVVIGAAGYFLVLGRGFSASDKPSRLEELFARRARKIATPADSGNLSSPQRSTPENLAEARHHFVEHCAICHGVDGRGQSVIGRNLYPQAPDMTGPDTQNLSDGELYYIIFNGVRFTGMPAWGREDSKESIWNLVMFIRHLPQLSPEELKEMKGMAEGEVREQGEKSGGGRTQEPGMAPHTHAPGTPAHKH